MLSRICKPAEQQGAAQLSGHRTMLTRLTSMQYKMHKDWRDCAHAVNMP
jgi:hypothetical protein